MRAISLGTWEMGSVVLYRKPLPQRIVVEPVYCSLGVEQV